MYPRNMVCFWYIIVNTLHNSDNKDNDDDDDDDDDNNNNNKVLELLTGTKKNCKHQTGRLLTIHGQHHPKADVDRLYIPRKQGGWGLMQLEAARAVEITKLVEYVDKKEDTNTTPTQQCYRQLDASRQKYREKQEK